MYISEYIEVNVNLMQGIQCMHTSGITLSLHGNLIEDIVLGSLKINMKLISQKNNYTMVVHIADIMLYDTVIIAIKYYCDFGDLEGASVAQA